MNYFLLIVKIIQVMEGHCKTYREVKNKKLKQHSTKIWHITFQFSPMYTCYLMEY